MSLSLSPGTLAHLGLPVVSTSTSSSTWNHLTTSLAPYSAVTLQQAIEMGAPIVGELDDELTLATPGELSEDDDGLPLTYTLPTLPALPTLPTVQQYQPTYQPQYQPMYQSNTTGTWLNNHNNATATATPLTFMLDDGVHSELVTLAGPAASPTALATVTPPTTPPTNASFTATLHQLGALGQSLNAYVSALSASVTPAIQQLGEWLAPYRDAASASDTASRPAVHKPTHSPARLSKSQVKRPTTTKPSQAQLTRSTRSITNMAKPKPRKPGSGKARPPAGKPVKGK